MKRFFLIILAVLLVLLCSCAQPQTEEIPVTPPQPTVTEPEKAPVETVVPQPQPEPEPEPEPQPVIPEFVNELSGLAIEESGVSKRPVAVMINNDKRSLPQSGIANADILLECEAEGGVTRMMALFKSYESLGVIGTVRSARDYFIDFAQVFDAIYVHAGGSPAAYEHIKSRKINNLDGVNMYLPDCFWRDPERLRTSALEHTLVTSGEKIAEKVKAFGYRTEHRSDYEPSLSFSVFPFELEGEVAEHIRIPRVFPSEFTYDAESGVYRHLQYETVQTDKETGTELIFDNVILLYVPQWPLKDDKNRIAVNFTGSGDGYFITKGKYIPIKWSRDSRDGGVLLTDGMGEMIELNPGRTFISIVNTYYYNTTEIR